MRYVLIPMACLAILPAACGKMPSELREYVQQDGDWGWGNGSGCKDRTDAWYIAGDRITIYSQGEIAGYLRLDERRGLYSNGLTSGSGAWTDMLWILHGPAPDGSGETGRQEMRLAIRGGPGRTTALRTYNHRLFIDDETGERRRIDEPRRGDRMIPCNERR